ncbi:hypothetical protein DdX_10854 [Ditylenchus destructor]|uniref:Uncharacterized protein n=1 Tax=Ditylenchus destructor TaxID=166010 RepID=A0AAD4N3D4_9BILA|nr:hypothetical protein DdX_10854 [Ditylenchus destructor]
MSPRIIVFAIICGCTTQQILSEDVRNTLPVDSSSSNEISQKSLPLAENDGPKPPPSTKSRLKRQNYGYSYYNYPSYNSNNYGYNNGYSNSPGYNNYYSSYGTNNGYGNNYYSNNGNGVTYNNNGIKTDYNTGYYTNGYYVSDGYDGIPYSEVPGWRIYYGSKDEGI